MSCSDVAGFRNEVVVSPDGIARGNMESGKNGAGVRRYCEEEAVACRYGHRLGCGAARCEEVEGSRVRPDWGYVGCVTKLTIQCMPLGMIRASTIWSGDTGSWPICSRGS